MRVVLFVSQPGSPAIAFRFVFLRLTAGVPESIMPLMLLVINVGNTNVLGGVFEGAKGARTLRDGFRVRTSLKKREDEYASIVRGVLAEKGVEPGAIDRVIVASVVPPLTDVIASTARRLFRAEPTIVGPAVYPKLPLGILAPDEIGTDLVADALAAFKKAGGACVVVDFGTGLSFTAVDADGTIAGVAIAPGLSLAVEALAKGTAQLPEIPIAAPPSVMGKNTVQSIQSGVVLGYVGLVEGIVGRMKRELGGNTRVFATGGLCRIVAPLTSVFDEVDPELTLKGLALMADLTA